MWQTLLTKVGSPALPRNCPHVAWPPTTPRVTATVQKVEALFPVGQLPLENALYEAPAFELQPTDVKKVS